MTAAWILNLSGYSELDVKDLPGSSVNYKNSGFQSKFESQPLVTAQPGLRARRFEAVESIVSEIDNSMIGAVRNVSVWGTIQTEFGSVTKRDRIIFHSSSLNKRYITYSNSNG